MGAASPVQAAIGATIRDQRKRKGLPIGDLSGRIGESVGTLSKWERGRLPIPTDRLSAIVAVLQFDAARLAELRTLEAAAEACTQERP